MHLCLFLLDHGLSTILLLNACWFDINVSFPGESRYVSSFLFVPDGFFFFYHQSGCLSTFIHLSVLLLA